MRQFKQQVNDEVKRFITDIIDGKYRNRRELKKALKALLDRLQVPIKEFTERLEEQMVKSAIQAEHAAVKMLMASSQIENIARLSQADIENIIETIAVTDIVFKRVSKGKVIKYTANMRNWVQKLGTDTVKRIESATLAGYISGDSPEEIARNIKRTHNIKKYEKDVKLISETWMHRAQQETNLQLFKANRKYIDWIKYQTAEDYRVDDECIECQSESERKKYSPTQYPADCIPPLHPRCRCALVAITQ